MNYNEEEISSASITHSVVTTAISARGTVESMETYDSLVLVSQFIEVLDEAGLITVDGAMGDLEKIERGMYAANLYLAACANIGKTATLRSEQIDHLEAMMRKS